MSSGRIQLASTGIQDYYLTDNPEITFFHQTYKRHTKFALETLDNPFEETAEFGTIVRCIIPRKGDLVRKIYFRFELPALPTDDLCYTNSIGNVIIDYADLIIGGQLIERLTGEYIEIYNNLYVSDSKQRSLEYLVGSTDSRLGLGVASSTTSGKYGKYPRTFVVPLPFYFNNHDSLSIPISALTRQEVEVHVKIRRIENLVLNTDPTDPTHTQNFPNVQLVNATLPVEYVFLDDDEYNYILNTRLEYLITQVQLSKSSIVENQNAAKFRLGFVNPVKEIYTVIQNSDQIESNIITGNDWFNFENPDNDSEGLLKHQLLNMKLEFNDEKIIDDKLADTSFLHALQPMLHHTRVPKSDRKFYTYSFSLDPESYFPTGQINMSRIQNKILSLELSESTKKRDIRIYAVSYNILRFEHGLAGLLFIDNNII